MSPLEETPPVALIIGASRGIGAATASYFADRGFVVFGTHRGSGVPAGVHPLMADVTDEQSISDAVRSASSYAKRLDVAVVSAGIAAQQLVVRSTVEVIREVLETNTIGAMLATKHAARAMSRRRAGSVVLVSSESARTGIPGSSAYTASKAALEGYMRSAMWEYGQLGIRLNVVAPGATETDMFAAVDPASREALLASTPLGRFARPDEIAEVIYWVSQSTYLNGACIPITGGEGLGY